MDATAGSPSLTDVTATASGGIDPYGSVADYRHHHSRVRSRFAGSPAVQVSPGGIALIAHSQIEGSVLAVGQVTCFGVYDANFQARTCP